METHVMRVESRTSVGKNANHKIRSNGYIPAVLYSHGQSQSIMVTKKEFFKIFKGSISENLLIDLEFINETAPKVKAFIKDYQRNPITDELIHLDFFKVTMTEAITTKVPVEIVGSASGVRQGGILEVVEREIEVECLPALLPEKIQIDVTNLIMGHSIHIKDIVAPDGVKFRSAPETVLVVILSPNKAAESAQPTAEAPLPADEQ